MWSVGFALVCASCLIVIFWTMQAGGSTAAPDSIATFQSKTEKTKAAGILKAADVSGVVSAENLTIPFSDFSKVATVSLEEAFARCIPGDPRYSPLMESLSTYFKDSDGQKPPYAIYFRNLSRTGRVTIKNLLDNGAIKFSWAEASAKSAGFFWLFPLVFSLYMLFGLRTKHDLAFRFLINHPWIIFSLVVPTVIGATIAILGCSVSSSVFMFHRPARNSTGRYALSAMSPGRLFQETGLYIIPMLIFLLIEKSAIPFFCAAAALEFGAFRYMDFFIGHFRRKLFHEPPAFRTILRKPPVPLKHLNYVITCASILLVLSGAFASPRPRFKEFLVDYTELYEHAKIQNAITFGRYQKPDGLNPAESSFAVFSRAPSDSRLVKNYLKADDRENLILRSMQDSSCLQITDPKGKLNKTFGSFTKPGISTRMPLDKGNLLVYIVAFIPILLSNFRGVLLSRKVYFTKTNIRQEA